MHFKKRLTQKSVVGSGTEKGIKGSQDRRNIPACWNQLGMVISLPLKVWSMISIYGKWNLYLSDLLHCNESLATVKN